ncbi:DUF4097 family beta strand repeat-containing protein [Gorillibacterium sp. sgz5001074]|uniref:DUF4097 family beta strand repeat-containing protein n=1 Tax=Gorillibacterium sp. sgz5001074 TaxID=3446695 RepID=UPI003F6750EF
MRTLWFNRRLLLLTSVVVLLALSILDVSFRKEEVFERFFHQFVNEEKMDAVREARPEVTVESRSQAEYPSQGLSSVALLKTGGNVEVTRSEDATIRLDAHIQATASDEAEAGRRRDTVQIKGETRDGQLTLTPVTASGKPVDSRNITIDYTLRVPDGLQLNLENRNGTVSIRGLRGNADVTAGYGLLEIRDTAGNLSLKLEGGSVYLSRITGNVKLDNRQSRLTADHIQGSVSLDSHLGHNDLAEVKGSVTGKIGQGSARLRDVTGPVELEGENTDLHLEGIRGNMKLSNEYGDTTLLLSEKEGYSLDAALRGGRLHTALPFPAEKRENEEADTRLKGTVGAGTWKTELNTRFGDLYIHTN